RPVVKLFRMQQQPRGVDRAAGEKRGIEAFFAARLARSVDELQHRLGIVLRNAVDEQAGAMTDTAGALQLVELAEGRIDRAADASGKTMAAAVAWQHILADRFGVDREPRLAVKCVVPEQAFFGTRQIIQQPRPLRAWVEGTDVAVGR